MTDAGNWSRGGAGAVTTVAAGTADDSLLTGGVAGGGCDGGVAGSDAGRHAQSSAHNNRVGVCRPATLTLRR